MNGQIGSTKLDPRVQTTVGAVPDAPPNNSFQQGMRQGWTSAGGSLRALAGGVGEALGANDFAKAQYAKAAEAEQLAATQAPEISQWQQVADAPDFSTGMRRAGSYVAGLAGGAAPFIAAGAGAAALTGGGAIPALLAGTAAVAPVEIGAALQRQQHDPAALANNGAGMRLGTAALEGTARSAAMMAVPQFMGGKLLGRIEQGAARSMPAAVATNVAEGVGGNALAGAAAEKISTTAEDVLNPNRDTSGDNARMLDAAVSGGALGVPFAGMGIAGHALHGKKPAPRTDGIPIDVGAATPLETAPVPKPSLQDRVKSLFAKGDNTIEQVAAGKDVVDVEALRAAAPEQQGEMLRAADADRMTKAKAWADELLAGDKLSPENRAALIEQTKNLSDRASQTFVAGLKMATDTGNKVLNAATEFYDALGKKDTPAPEGIKLSSISSGAEKAIGDVVAPHLDAKYPDLMRNENGRKAVTGTLRRAMDDMQKTGKLDPDMAEHLHGWFGDSTPSVLAELHDKVMGDSPAAVTEKFDGDRLSNSTPNHKKLYPGSSQARNGIAAVVDTLTQSPTDRYFGAINKMTDSMGEQGKLTEKVKAALRPELQAGATPDSLRDATRVLREVASGAHTKDMVPERAAFENKRVEDTLRAHFGDKTTSLLDAFKKDADKRAAKLVDEQASAVTSKSKLDEGGFADTPEAGVTKETDKIYFGGGNDKAAPTFVLSERAHNAQYGGEGQAARLLRDARAKHPDMNVMTVPAEVYAREHDWGKQQLMDATNGKPQDHVMIKAEGIKRDGLTWQDVESMKNDSHNYPDSPSRIPTDAGITLDAVRVLNHYAQEHKLPRNETDAISPAHRMARQFKEAIGAISDHLGEMIHMQEDGMTPEQIKALPENSVLDSTVVARRGGKAVTWKELREQSRIPDSDLAQTRDNAIRERAVKAGDKGVIDRIDEARSDIAMEHNDPKNELPDGQPKRNAVNNERDVAAAREAVAATAKELGAARKAVEVEMAKNPPLRDGDGKMIRPLTFRERALVRIHDALIRDYANNEYEGNLGRASEFGTMKDQLMMGEAPLDRNVHWGEKQYGDALGARFKASEMQDAQGNPLHANNFTPDTHFDGRPTPEMISGVESRVSQFEANKAAPARAVGEKGRVLVELMKNGQMKLQDAALLSSIITDKSALSRAEQINSLYAQYKDVVVTAKVADSFTSKLVQPIDTAPKLADFRKQTAAASDAVGMVTTMARVAKELGHTTPEVMAQAEKIRDWANKWLTNTAGMGKLDRSLDMANIGMREQLRTAAIRAEQFIASTEVKKAAAKKPNAFVERVLAGGQDFDKIVKHVKTTDDVRGLQRAVDSLAGRDDPRSDTVLRAANERIASMIEKDPTVAYSMQRVGAKAIDPVVQGDIKAHVNKVLGKSVDVEFAKLLHAGEFERGTAGANDILRVSVHSLDPMSTAFHESLHAFIAKLGDSGLVDKANPLFKAADSTHVRGQLRRLLAGEPDALKQIENSAEERAAYMYQFWERSMLDVTGAPRNALEKIAGFFKRILGMWTNDQRAEHIMEYFGSGEYAKNMGDRNAVSRALERNSTIDLGLKRRYAEFRHMVGPLDTLAARVIMTGDAQVRSLKNAALNEMLDKVYSPMQGTHNDVGYMPAARAKRTQVLNSLASDLGSYDAATVTDALRTMQRGERGATPEERQVVLRVRKTLDAMYRYMLDKGVKMGDLGYEKDYFPRVWDTNKILANEQAFRDMMQHYVDKGDFKGSVDQVIATLTRTDGSDLQVETAKPGMQHTRERILAFIAGRDAQPFLNENLYQTLNSYISQGTRRAEWAHRFGDDGAGLKALFESARAQGATEEHITTAMKYLKSVDGTLGDTIDPKLRRAFGNAIVYQNIRILPMMIFSSMIDAGGIMVRGGLVSEAFNTFKRGFAEIPEGFKKVGNQKHDAATQLAETMGTIDSAVLMHTLGSSYSQGMTSDMGRRVNDTLFKYNLAEQYNRSMRVGATEAAVAFLGRHADGTESIHSPRWLAELGFKPGEIKLGADGRPLLHAHEFEAAGFGKQLDGESAQHMSDKITVAVNKWVDGAILRPNAAHKPIWMSDPHFALVAHLKQFVYSFQETILKRVVNEARHGNIGPAYSLAAYVPFMLAADLAKGALLNGGGVPAGRQNWDVSDYAWYETQRAGLFGVGQFGIDMAKDFHRGGLGIGALTGPTLEQLGDAVSTVGGTQQFKTFALNSLPANQLYDAVESASTNAID